MKLQAGPGLSVEDWVKQLPLFFRSSSAITTRVSDARKRGLIRKVGPSLYTTDTTTPLEELTVANAAMVASLRFPGAVVSFRSAFEGRPTNGYFFLTGSHERTDVLPGMTIRLIKGPGPLSGDTELLDLYQASRARAFLENLKKTRRAKGISRVLSRGEIESRLELLLQQGGEDALNTLRDSARELAPFLDAEAAFDTLNNIIGALLSTKEVALEARTAVARAAGTPFDESRMERFGLLAEELARTWQTASRPAKHMLRDERQNLAFIDAYFSNYIEGTKFEIGEAEDIVFNDVVPKGRPADAHDVKGTYALLVDQTEMLVSAAAFDAFEDFDHLLKRRHRRIMNARPEAKPGEYKKRANRAGDTVFVSPGLVRGTLMRGFELFKTLDTPFQRAAFMMFLIAEVHPFEDGNGRLARAMLNAELSSGDETRIIIVTAYRTDYLDVLRRLSRQNDPKDYPRMLDRAQEFVSRLAFEDLPALLRTLETSNAFDDTGQRRMRLPPRA